MLGCELNSKKFEISIYEGNQTLGRKFLVAGDGGLNLTHSENVINFIERYTPSSFLQRSFKHFSNVDLIKWINNLGIETFVGTSGRVFPKKGIKPAEVLNIILKKINSNSVNIYTKHVWKGFSNGHLLFENNGQAIEIKADHIIFCLGGASWPVTGSKGDWTNYFLEKNIKIDPFKASNCAFKINWEKELEKKIEGKILKNISINCGNKTQLGEVTLTKFGIEGSGIYPLSPQIRAQLTKNGKAEISIDLKPSLSPEKIIQKLSSGKKNITDTLKTELNLSLQQVQLLKTFVSKEDFLAIDKLADHLKNFKLTLVNTAPINEAISTIGGICLDEIGENFELKKLPDHFTIGEMLDYDAPTGGYLLQSCFSMAKYLADYLDTKN